MSLDAPVYPLPGSQPNPVPAPGRRRWLIIAVAGWAVLLLVLGYLSFRRDAPTVPEQRDIAEASRVADRAIGELAAAAAADPDVVLELPAWRLESCEISALRDGTSLERDIVLRTTGTDGPALLDRIAQRLPSTYRAGTRTGVAGTKLRADAGEFVVVEGAFTEPHLATISARTGCRPNVPDFRPVLPAAGIPAEQTVDRILDALGGRTGGQRERVSAACPSGGQAATVRATVAGTPSTPLARALRPVAGANAVVVSDKSDEYAYRSGTLSVLAEATGGEIRVTATTACSTP